MAKFIMETPDEIMKDFRKIYDNTEHIFGEMTRAGAEVALAESQAKCPPILKPYGKLTKTYRTPTDGGINTKIIYSGYVPFSTPGRKYFARRNGKTQTVYYTDKGVPVEFLAIMYEYGRSGNPFPKQPFLRKSFNKNKIEKAMLKAQKEASGGILDE